jgi:hypothetical protein
VLKLKPIGFAGKSRSEAGKLYFESTARGQDSKALVLSWRGSQRFGAALIPRRTDMPEPKLELVAGTAAMRIGSTDWVSLGDLEAQRRIGLFQHLSEYVVVREQGKDFPALLMIGGLEFQSGPHSLISNKPLSVSLGGVKGGMRSTRPDTVVALRSPVIKPGDRFLLDGATIAASPDGLLSLSLAEPGEHRLSRAQ